MGWGGLGWVGVGWGGVGLGWGGVGAPFFCDSHTNQPNIALLKHACSTVYL